MANIMSMKSIRNNPHRAGYDLSRKINFTMKAGMMLPVWYTPVLPFDKLMAEMKAFVRTQPFNTAAFARMRGYFNFYFVPFNQLWNKFPTAITQMKTNLQHASGPVLKDNNPLSSQLPFITAEQIAKYIISLGATKNQFGYYRAYLTCILLEYLGYGDFYAYCSKECVDSAGKAFPECEGATWETRPMLVNLKFSPFPLFCYQKCYSDYNRYTQWERANPSTFNVDYISGSPESLQLDLSVEGFTDSFNFLDVRYSNFQRDLLHGVIPQAQYGEASVVPVGGELKITPDGALSLDWDSLVGTSTYAQVPTKIQLKDTDTVPKGSLYGMVYAEESNTKYPTIGGTTPLKYKSGLQAIADQANFNVSILAFRRAEAAQKWKEVAMAAEEDYKSQIEAHWGESVSELLSGMCQWLGSVNIDLSVNEVVNTNITADNAADIAGKGTMSGQGGCKLDVDGRYGIVMCIFHVLPQLDYTTTAPDFAACLTDVLQYPIPEFDQIGMEEVPVIRGLNPVKPSDGDFKVSSDLFFGYAPQYYDWKTTLDKSMGEFRRSLKSWIIPFGDDELLAADSINFPDNPNVESDSVKAGFFKVNPAILDHLFAVNADSSTATDQFLCSTFFDVKVVRKLDPNGLPY